MNRTDRLLAIVLELEARGRQRAEDLAATFETSKRTIYRDIQALAEAGVPLVSVPGQGYSLVEGYFLPPLMFSADEATLLLLGTDFMAQHFDAQYRDVALAAARKIEAVLPKSQRDEVHYLQANICFVAAEAVSAPSLQEMMAQLRRAIIERRMVRVRYRSRSTAGEGEVTTREVDPYRLLYMTGAWYLVGYCHLRRDVRNFRLSRIEQFDLLSQTFTRPANFTLAPERRDGQEQRTIIVRALFDASVARWAQESRFFYVVDEVETPDGLLMTLTVRNEDEPLPWLLSWGAHVRVLEPASLRERIVAEAEAMVQQHREAAF